MNTDKQVRALVKKARSTDDLIELNGIANELDRLSAYEAADAVRKIARAVRQKQESVT